MPDSLQLLRTLFHVSWLAVAFFAVAWGLGRTILRHSVRLQYALHTLSLILLPVLAAVLLFQEMDIRRRTAERETRGPLSQKSGGVFDQLTSSTSEPIGGPRSELQSEDSQHAGSSPPNIIDDVGASHSSADSVSDFESSKAVWVRCISLGYVFGVMFMLLRLAVSSSASHRIHHSARKHGLPLHLESSEKVARQVGMRCLPLIAICDRIVMPAVCGLFRQVILVPSSVVAGLTPSELEAVLIHELIHVKRRDSLVLLLQRLTEVLLFFHPAVWWLSRSVSELREKCCDDRVLASGVAPQLYANSLLRLVEIHRAKPQHFNASLLAASGAGPSEVRRRIARILGVPLAAPPHGMQLSYLLLLAVGAGATATLIGNAAQPVVNLATRDESATVVREVSPEIPDVFGKVFGSDGRPVGGANVWLRPHRLGYKASGRPRGVPVMGMSKTAADGSFRISDLTTPKLSAGWTPSEIFPLEVIVLDDQYAMAWCFAPVDTPIEVHLRSAGSVSGIVTDGDGRPVGDVKLRVSSFLPLTELVSLDLHNRTPRHIGAGSLAIGDTGPNLQTTTNRNGEFTLRSLPVNAGVELSVSGSLVLPTQIYTCANAEHPRVLEIRNGTIRTEPIALTLERAVALQVRVVNAETREPIEGANVRVRNASLAGMAVTDASGMAKVGAIDPGVDSTLVASLKDSGFLSNTLRVNPRNVSSDVIEIPLHEGVRVTGRVFDSATGEGAKDVRLSFRAVKTPNSRADGGESAQTDNNGKFDVLLAEGTWKLSGSVRAAGYEPSNRPVQFVASRDASPQPLEFPLVPTKHLIVTVVNPDGSPAAGASVVTQTHVTRRGNGVSYRNFEGTTDSNGVCRVRGIYDGVSEQQVDDWYHTPIRIRTHDSSVAAVVGTPPPEADGNSMLKVVLHPTGAISGRVFDSETGRPIAGATVVPCFQTRTHRADFSSYRADDLQRMGRCRSGSKGDFRIDGLIPGQKYSVRVHADGYRSSQKSEHVDVASGITLDAGIVELHPQRTGSWEAFQLRNDDVGGQDVAMERLKKWYKADYGIYRDGLSGLNNSGQRSEYVRMREPTGAYIRKLSALAHQYPGSDFEVEALVWIVGARRTAGVKDPEGDQLRAQAAARLVDEYSDRSEIATCFPQLYYSDPKRISLQEFSTDSPSRDVRAAAYAMIARVNTPSAFRASNRPAPRQSSAVRALEQLRDNYPDVSRPGWNMTYGEWASRELTEFRTLQPGLPAPMPGFRTVDGLEVTSADFNGKVVLLIFHGGFYGTVESTYALSQEFPETLVVIHVVDKPAAEALQLIEQPFAHGLMVAQNQHQVLEDAWCVSSWTSYSVIDSDGAVAVRQVRRQEAWDTARRLLKTRVRK